MATDVTRYECKRSTWIQRDVDSGSAIHPARLPLKSSSSWKRREREAVLTSEWEESAEKEERGRRERRGKGCEHPKIREKTLKSNKERPTVGSFIIHVLTTTYKQAEEL